MLLKTIIIWLNLSRWSILFFLYTFNFQNCTVSRFSWFLGWRGKKFAGLKKVRWLTSRDRALKVIATNYKTLCTHLENISNYEKTNNSAKTEGLVKKIKSLKFLAYLYFMLDFIPLLLDFFCLVILLRTQKIRKW